MNATRPGWIQASSSTAPRFSCCVRPENLRGGRWGRGRNRRRYREIGTSGNREIEICGVGLSGEFRTVRMARQSTGRWLIINHQMDDRTYPETYSQTLIPELLMSAKCLFPILLLLATPALSQTPQLRKVIVLTRH